MDSINTLDRVIYGKLADQPVLLAASGGLTAQDAENWYRFIQLDPLPIPDAAASQAVGVFRIPDAYILARALNAEGDLSRPTYELVLLKRSDLQAVAGYLHLLTDLVDAPLLIPGADDIPLSIAALPIPSPPTWTPDKRLLALNTLLRQYEFRAVLTLLGAALHPRGLMIRGFAKALNERIDLLQAILLLLPTVYRADLTFSTNVQQVTDTPAIPTNIVFCDDAEAANYWIWDVGAESYPDFEAIRTPYIDCLDVLWHAKTNEDAKEFVSELRAMELLTARVSSPSGGTDAPTNGLPLNQALNTLAVRYLQDKQVMAGDLLPVEVVKAALTEAPPPTGELRERYVGLLLDHAISVRDAEAALIVTRSMDDDPALDEAMQKRLGSLLDDQPDAVYFVIRTRLAQGVDEHWLPRLHAAAINSLRVAVNDSDANTLLSWLKLIAREPAAYQLGDVLLQGVRAAQDRARVDGALGYQLIVFAVRRAPGSVDTLLDDNELVEALPTAARHALRDYDPDAVLALATEPAAAGRELFLVALRCAALEKVTTAFIPETIHELWALRAEEQLAALSEPYRPQTILRLLITEGIRWLSDDVLMTLLVMLLTNREDNQFVEMAPRLVSANGANMDMLSTALFRSGRSADDVLLIVGQVANAGVLTTQQVVDIYMRLLTYHEWGRQVLPLAEQIARSVQHNPALVIDPDVSWRMLEVAETGRIELVGRVMLRRLLADVEKMEDERSLIEDLLRLYEQIQWSSSLKQFALHWWRDFVRQQPLARLQAFDKALDGKRPLEEARQIVQTSINLRRVFGKRSLEDFADAIATTYSILQALSDSFDPAPKQTTHFDQATVREELEARQSELTPDERRVLAKNLRELGGLIADMAEHRSRATLMRREDEIERQLMSGEITPHSAIDAMKWFSGYLDGVQDRGEEGEG